MAATSLVWLWSVEMTRQEELTRWACQNCARVKNAFKGDSTMTAAHTFNGSWSRCFAMTGAKISDKYMSLHFHFPRWPEIVFHCKNVSSASRILKNMKKNIHSVFGCTWLMTCYEDNRSSRTTRRRSRGRRQSPTFLEVGPAHGEEEEKAIYDWLGQELRLHGMAAVIGGGLIWSCLFPGSFRCSFIYKPQGIYWFWNLKLFLPPYQGSEDWLYFTV